MISTEILGNIYEQLTKHIRKGIIIKNDKELNKYKNSIYEGNLLK